MNTWLIAILNKFGYLGIAFLIAVENIFPPIPSEVILSFGGYLTTKTEMNIVGVIISATIGSIFGAVILYSIGLFFNEDKIYALIDGKCGKRLGFKHDDLTKAINWFNKWGKFGTFFGRCVPVIRSIISIPAGMVKMEFWQFMLYTTLGSALWNIILVSSGAYLGENFEKVLDVFDQYKHIVMVIFALIGLYFIFWWIKRIREQKKGN